MRIHKVDDMPVRFGFAGKEQKVVRTKKTQLSESKSLDESINILLERLENLEKQILDLEYRTLPFYVKMWNWVIKIFKGAENGRAIH